MALISFNDGISNYTSLTNDTGYLNSTIDGYTANGGTCICCAENKAYEIVDFMLLYNEEIDYLTS